LSHEQHDEDLEIIELLLSAVFELHRCVTPRNPHHRLLELELVFLEDTAVDHADCGDTVVFVFLADESFQNVEGVELEF
jgi:hypothetical protein